MANTAPSCREPTPTVTNREGVRRKQASAHAANTAPSCRKPAPTVASRQGAVLPRRRSGHWHLTARPYASTSGGQVSHY